MATNQGLRQEAVRARSGTARSYNEDWIALFDTDGIAAGAFSERFRNWLNAELVTDGDLSAPYASLFAAQSAYAAALGVTRWSDAASLL